MPDYNTFEAPAGTGDSTSGNENDNTTIPEEDLPF